jgi:hypothetical protein
VTALEFIPIAQGAEVRLDEAVVAVARDRRGGHHGRCLEGEQLTTEKVVLPGARIPRRAGGVEVREAVVDVGDEVKRQPGREDRAAGEPGSAFLTHLRAAPEPELAVRVAGVEDLHLKLPTT